MNLRRKRRLYLVISIIVAMFAAASLAIYALGQNINLYFTPTQLLQNKITSQQLVRLGGMVKAGSIQRVPNSLQVTFVVTDYHHDIPVNYTGILPTLFRAGQGIVVQGRFEPNGEFIADQVLAKHDENYMPPGLKKPERPDEILTGRR